MKQATPPRLSGLAFIFFIGVYILASLLVLDNYDSFTYNLFQYIGICGSECITIRNDKFSIQDIFRTLQGTASTWADKRLL